MKSASMSYRRPTATSWVRAGLRSGSRSQPPKSTAPRCWGPFTPRSATATTRSSSPRPAPPSKPLGRNAGLPAELADAGDTDGYDEAPRASHREGITLVGADVGSPIIAIPGSGPDPAKIAFFGPVVTPAPKGEAAARLWDSTLILVSTPASTKSSAPAQSAPSSSEVVKRGEWTPLDEARHQADPVHQVVGRWVAAFNSHDPAEMAALFASDALFQGFGPEPWSAAMRWPITTRPFPTAAAPWMSACSTRTQSATTWPAAL
jgi:hypothetical protein